MVLSRRVTISPPAWAGYSTIVRCLLNANTRSVSLWCALIKSNKSAQQFPEAYSAWFIDHPFILDVLYNEAKLSSRPVKPALSTMMAWLSLRSSFNGIVKRGYSRTWVNSADIKIVPGVRNELVDFLYLFDLISLPPKQKAGFWIKFPNVLKLWALFPELSTDTVSY